MTGHHNFIAKAICLVFNGKKMMADAMDKGLANLKSVVEGRARPNVLLSEAALRTAMNFDFSQFYLSADGRVNRQQWWLRLIVALLVIGVVLSIIDMALGTYNPRTGCSFCSCRSSAPSGC